MHRHRPATGSWMDMKAGDDRSRAGNNGLIGRMLPMSGERFSRSRRGTYIWMAGIQVRSLDASGPGVQANEMWLCSMVPDIVISCSHRALRPGICRKDPGW